MTQIREFTAAILLTALLQLSYFLNKDILLFETKFRVPNGCKCCSRPPSNYLCRKKKTNLGMVYSIQR